LPVIRAECVGFLLVQAFREGGIRIEEVPNVSPTALDKVQGELLAERFARIELDLGRQVLKLAVQHAQERAEGRFVAAVRRRRYKHDMAFGRLCDLPDEFVTKLTSCAFAARGRATVSFIHDNKLGALVSEVITTPLTFNEVGGHDDEGMAVEHGNAKWQI